MHALLFVAAQMTRVNHGRLVCMELAILSYFVVIIRLQTYLQYCLLSEKRGRGTNLHALCVVDDDDGKVRN
jgi:hypothetical protein